MSARYEANEAKATESRSRDAPQSRRKVRKGTWSCWECKRRKKRCIFSASSTNTCNACLRLKRPCISQEYDEEEDNSTAKLDQQLDRVESLVSQLMEQRKAERCKAKRIPSAIPRSMTQAAASTRCSLADFLKSTLPLPQLATLILKNGHSAFSWMYPQTQTCPLTRILTGSSAITLDALPQTIQPVVFARKLVELALCLRQPSFQPGALTLLPSFDPHQTARRYIHAAQHVTSQDLLVRSVDGLETLLLEALYQVHLGNIETSCRIFRRAVGIAQTMELHRLPPTADRRIKYLWFRLVYTDRWHALGYGLASVVMDKDLPPTFVIESESLVRRLDEKHIGIAGRVIERNLRLQSMGRDNRGAIGSAADREESMEIDGLLKAAMQSLPPDFWTYKESGTSTDRSATETTSRLMVHIHQSYLTILVHQPWILLAAAHVGVGNSVTNLPAEFETHGQMATLTAARELLSRLPYLLSFPHVQPSLKGLRHKIHLAMTMTLLVHLHSACSPGKDFFGHQRPHDLGLISETLGLVSDLYDEISGGPWNETFETLQRLTCLVQHSPSGFEGHISSDWCSSRNVVSETDGSSTTITLSYPYFGRVRVILNTATNFTTPLLPG